MHFYTFYTLRRARGLVMFRDLMHSVIVLSDCIMGSMPLERAKTIFLHVLTPSICYIMELTKTIVGLSIASSWHWGLTALLKKLWRGPSIFG